MSGASLHIPHSPQLNGGAEPGPPVEQPGGGWRRGLRPPCSGWALSAVAVQLASGLEAQEKWFSLPW